MEPIVLTDPSVEPNDELLFSIIGPNRVFWEAILDFLKNHHSDITGEWRYYNDGKSWLYRGLRKEKVIYWVGVHATTFRVTFYLSNKAEALIENSNISDQRKEEFYETAGKKFRHISILMQNMDDVEDVKKLIEIKLKVK